MKILLGITGSIAAYKTPELLRQLIEAGHEVKIALTQSARAFVSSLTLETLLPHRVFDTLMEPSMQHIELAKWAEVFLIAPMSANTLAKFAHGVADNLLSAIYLATQAKLIMVPAMNQSMWRHVATQANVQVLKNRGVEFFGPTEGIQACGDIGPGRMLETEEIIRQLQKLFEIYNSVLGQTLKNKNILITAGPTEEAIDPVRFISNKSSGKMGYALAQAALGMGAHVTLITGPTILPHPPCQKIIQVKSAGEMYHAAMANLGNLDIMIAAAAVSDYTIKAVSQKLKKENHPLKLTLIPTVDIVSEVCKQPDKPFVICFAAETENIIENAQQKLKRKGADMIIANDVSRTNIGFDQDENEVFLISKNTTKMLAKASKLVIAKQIMESIA